MRDHSQCIANSCSLLRDEIVKKHAEGISLVQQVRETLLRKLECTRKTGILIDGHKIRFAVKHGENSQPHSRSMARRSTHI